MTLMNILVDNISLDVSETDLYNVLKTYGEIASVNFLHNKDGASKEVALVVMVSNEAAKSAIAGLDGKNLKGSRLKVSEAPESL